MLARVMLIAAVLGWAASPTLALAETDAPEPEAPESVVSSPPMEMDDPGTPGKNGIEVNFVATMIHVGAGRSSEGLFDANYGIGDRLQLKYERPWVREHDPDLPFQSGLGATELGIKWRFMDSHGIAMAIYPQYEFDDGFRIKDELGNVEESEGRFAYVPLLVSQTVGKVYSLAFNYGYRHSYAGHGDDNNVALGIGRAMGGDGRVLAELYSERDESFHNRQTDARVGVAFLPFPEMFAHSKFEAPVYASIGHSIGATEAGERSTSIVFGVSVIMKPTE